MRATLGFLFTFAVAACNRDSAEPKEEAVATSEAPRLLLHGIGIRDQNESSLSMAEIVLRENLGMLSDCTTQSHGPLRGILALDIAVGGEVAEAEARGVPKVVAECWVRAAKEWRFPDGVGATRVEATIGTPRESRSRTVRRPVR